METSYETSSVASLNLCEGQRQLVSVSRTTRSFTVPKLPLIVLKKFYNVELEEIQFGLEQTLARNEAQVILNQIKLRILSDWKNSKRKATDYDTDKDDIDALTFPTEKLTTTLQSYLHSQKVLNESIELDTYKKGEKGYESCFKSKYSEIKKCFRKSIREKSTSEKSSSSD
ncbi:10542_t:CDS:2 [Funneliformis geosporum]|uniref:2792_t:CDS:1 n=1 Tax=Funneliformis geosporum TaxID=1117311 RepID=A0A9W4SY35_9GLOM|nr:2792_t:CDS:2 [Funneliformis geosporum]CAI2188494.1 10542_t:CDS:2 [Funneliformis geosporum]